MNRLPELWDTAFYRCPSDCKAHDSSHLIFSQIITLSHDQNVDNLCSHAKAIIKLNRRGLLKDCKSFGIKRIGYA